MGRLGWTFEYVRLYVLLAIAIGGCSEPAPAPSVSVPAGNRPSASDASEKLGETVPVKRRQVDAELDDGLVLEDMPVSSQVQEVWEGPTLCAFGNDENLVIRLSDKAAKAVRRIVAAAPIPDGASILEKAEPFAMFEIDGNSFGVYFDFLMNERTKMVWKHPGISALSNAIDPSQLNRVAVEAALAEFAENG